MDPVKHDTQQNSFSASTRKWAAPLGITLFIGLVAAICLSTEIHTLVSFVVVPLACFLALVFCGIVLALLHPWWTLLLFGFCWSIRTWLKWRDPGSRLSQTGRDGVTPTRFYILTAVVGASIGALSALANGVAAESSLYSQFYNPLVNKIMMASAVDNHGVAKLSDAQARDMRDKAYALVNQANGLLLYKWCVESVPSSAVTGGVIGVWLLFSRSQILRYLHKRRQRLATLPKS